MDIIIKLNEQTAGRDKIIRLLQYGSRLYWYYAQNTNCTRKSADILRSLEFTFSSFRKLLRLGRCLDSLYSAMKALKHPNVALRITMTMSKLTNALFLLADHIIWIGRAGILRVDIEKWNKIANKYWLISIIINLARDIYEIFRILEQQSRNAFKQRRTAFAHSSKPHCDTLFCLKDRKDVIIDTVKNGCDLFIPLTALGFTKLHPGAVGMFGVISSVIGIYTLVYPFYKLVPS